MRTRLPVHSSGWNPGSCPAAFHSFANITGAKSEVLIRTAKKTREETEWCSICTRRPAAKGWSPAETSRMSRDGGGGGCWGPEEDRGLPPEVPRAGSLFHAHQHHQPPTHEPGRFCPVKTQPGGSMGLRNKVQQRPRMTGEAENRGIQFCNWGGGGLRHPSLSSSQRQLPE